MSTLPTASQFLHVSLQSPTLPLLMRTPTPDDASAIHSILNNPLNTELDTPKAGAATTGNGPTLEGIESMIQRWREAAAEEKPGRLNLVVVDTTTGKVEGIGGFGHIATLEDGTRCGNVGVMLNPDARGKGFGSEAIRLSVEWGFDVAGLGEQSVGTLERNVGMLKVIEKVLVSRGWKGERRKLENGEWEWEWEFKISKESWENGEKSI